MAAGGGLAAYFIDVGEDEDDEDYIPEDEEEGEEEDEDEEDEEEEDEEAEPELLTEAQILELISDDGDDSEEEEEEKGGGEVELPEKTKMSTEKDGAVWEYEADCPVCMEPWTEEGRHQSCSLACGHTFGRSCIEKWLREWKKNNCPKCKKRCKISDIRPIYPTRVAIVYKVLEKELNIVKAEKSLLEIEIQNKAIMLESANLEIERMRKEMEKMEEESQRMKIDISRETFNQGHRKRLFEDYDEQNGLQDDFAYETKKCKQRDFPYRFCLKQELRVDGARVFDMDASSNIMLLSRRLSGVNGGCVLSKINLLYPSESENIPLPPTHKVIRDLSISQRPDKLALMASMGKKLSIFSWQSNNFVHTYDLPAPAWSCTWDVNDVHHVYAGLQNGMLAIFDLRQTASPLNLKMNASSFPIHTLHSVENEDRPSAARRIISGSADGPCLWNIDNTHTYGMSHFVPNMKKEEVCISLAYSGASDDIVATFRPKVQTDNLSQPGVSLASFPGSLTIGSHVYIKWQKSNISVFNPLEPKSVYVNEVRMPKSAIISLENSRPVFAYGDEGSQSVIVKELPSLNYVDGLKPHEGHILDVKYVSSSNSHLLGCISESSVQVFSVVSS